MFNNIVKNWNFIRLLRLAMGIFLVVEAVKSGMWFLVAVGAVFVAMPLLNIGCCTNGNCSVPYEIQKAQLMKWNMRKLNKKVRK